MNKNDPCVGLLHIFVKNAVNLPKMDATGKKDHRCDPYVVIRFGTTEERKSKTVTQDQNPHWNETFRILMTQTSKKYDLEFHVYDWDRLTKDDFVGKASVDVSKLVAGAKQDMILQLKDGAKQRGELNVSITLKDWDIVEKEFWTSFAKHFDYDNSKTLSMLELSGMLDAIESHADEDGLHTFFKSIDKNNDGEINFDEFVAAMQKTTKEIHANPVLKKIIPEGTVDFIWYVSSILADDTDIGTIMVERGFYGKVDIQKKPGKVDKILVHNRLTGKVEEEKIPEYIHLSLKMMYATNTGRFGLSGIQLDSVLKHLTDQQGKKMDSPKSAKGIQDFITFHNLDTQEILEPSIANFKTFNEFFYRKLKKSARPIASPDDPTVAVSPADCRLHVFQTVGDATKLWVKGKQFSILNLLNKNEALAKEFDGGNVVIARLAPQDYHRFHIPVDCKVISRTEVSGRYYTVNPIAVNEDVDVFTENKRVISVLESPQFGKVAYISIGATLVGSIVFTVNVGDSLKKGDEYGYFAFGGSTVITLFKKGSIQFSSDIVANSLKPIETLVKMGEVLGEVPKSQNQSQQQQQKH